MSKKRHSKLSKRHRRGVIRDKYGRIVTAKSGRSARKAYRAHSTRPKYGYE